MKSITKKVLILGLVFNFSNIAFADSCQILVKQNTGTGASCKCGNQPGSVDVIYYDKGKEGTQCPPTNKLPCSATCKW